MSGIEGAIRAEFTEGAIKTKKRAERRAACAELCTLLLRLALLS
jgi:hypothetical protein